MTEAQKVFVLAHEPKLLELEQATEDRVRLILTLSKLGQVTKLDFVLDRGEAEAFAAALVT